MKELVVDNAPKRIKHIQFGVLSPQEMAKAAEFEVTQRDLYNVPDRTPVKHGVLDMRLGTSEKSAACDTCGLPMAECIGHFGYLRLCVPVFHIGYFRAIINILQTICKSCSCVLLDEEKRRVFLRRLRNPHLDSLQRRLIVKAVQEESKKVVYCPHCKGTNGTVKKVGALKIIHEKFRQKRTATEKDAFRRTFDTAVEFAPDIKAHLSKAHDDMNPLKVLRLFEAISSEDCELLGLDPQHGRPELYIWTAIPVPPVCIRPSVSQDGGSTEDDLTVKLTEIIFTNALIKAGLDKGGSVTNLMEQWEFLQLSAAMYINSELPGVQSLVGGKPIRGFCQRLKGKQGRFRGNLSGKRVDFSGRTVISPDPNLRIDQIAVPVHVAKILTFPERVNEHNIEKLRQRVLNGTENHPGANYIQLKNGLKRFLKFTDLKKAANDLRVGDVVERHLDDGDAVLFNRQPSLHKLSIMCHFAKIRPWRTFRFNECVCNPYNADFDGDEMNLHVPQTEEARAEAIELMGVKNNLVTPRNGEPIIAAIQDFITASFLLSRRDVFYDRAQFVQICNYLADAELHIDIPPPTVIKPKMLWTGKQVFNVLMRPNKKSNVLVNLECKCRSFSKPKGQAPEMCPDDGFLVIRNSEVMCGVMDKATVGDGNKNSLFYVVLRDYGPQQAASCMNRLSKLCARWLGNMGFSIGINDVQPGDVLRNKKDALVETAYSECDQLIEDKKHGRLVNQPGCNEEQTLEAKISGVLSKVRDDVGQICMTELNKYNAPLIMSICGSKGSKINVSQMVACVGQQIISGSRIPDGFVDRSLPHFLKNSKIPPAKGFVRNSFYSGLTPTEFFFHAVSGREGLVDTAVKTAETGYMQRRLMKALEDLTTHYDYSVRTSSGGVVQFEYGSDGLDPVSLEGNGIPVAFERNLRHAMSVVPSGNNPMLMPWQIEKIVQEEMESPRFAKCKEAFRDSVAEFVRTAITEKIVALRLKHSLDAGTTAPVKRGARSKKAPVDAPVEATLRNVASVTESQLRRFLEICGAKYMKAMIEPGTAVGAVGAQSIGEPGTQMTLKTFHFAGVASMNITLGVPRIKEIINAAKTISTPVIKCRLECDSSETSARIVKGRVETTMLGNISKYIDEVFSPNRCYLEVHLDEEVMHKLQLEINIQHVADAIARAPKLKIGAENVQIRLPDRIQVFVSQKDGEVYFAMQSLKRALSRIIVAGIPSVHRAVISNETPGKYEVAVEGTGLREVMNAEGIIGTETTSNHIMEVQKVLGIEAARSTIINEIDNTMKAHGMTIDPRHVMLLGDIMTYKGEVLGITRFGVAKMKDSVLMLASFEKTTDHLFDASLFGKRDAVEGRY
ncbi:beta and beta-prime subunits of DNA dependent RNA-polymerase [Thamnocephalis sphaerospora]|uniref:DNA-directed RNA polymerase subunit n=1 Tax=Thamnocephalis sphaerospora TaxID=78915 RepID=A0A4P9XN84_9FUNG|nr:beta and beta-prime subunits of DNA dependent RNA-polymerase [Thamnocephalis sphaerospora]|eukprot:RKP06871.1 beta and beta-prime subunits of DNA dependent RNA-polymerase [Thamnocephalis sphaerospora]